MRGLLRDKDFLIVCGCLVAGILQVRAQRSLLKALRAAAARQAAEAAEMHSHRRHQPMRYNDASLQEVIDAGPLRNAFGMN